MSFSIEVSVKRELTVERTLGCLPFSPKIYLSNFGLKASGTVHFSEISVGNCKVCYEVVLLSGCHEGNQISLAI